MSAARARLLAAVVAPAAVALLSPGCGRPTLDALLADKHYAEAICAVDMGDEPDRRRVQAALERDTRVRARAVVLQTQELANRFGDAAPALDAARVRVVRVEVDTNVLPIDSFSAGALLEGSLTPDPAALVKLTGEPEPPRVEVDTAATPGNALRLLGWIFMPYLAVDPTIREAMMFRTERVLARAPIEHYRETAPRAMRIFDGLEGKCEPRGGGPRLSSGSRCEGLFLVDTASESALRLRVVVHYGAHMMNTRSDPEKRSSCSMQGVTELDLGSATALDATLKERFGRGPVRLPLRIE